MPVGGLSLSWCLVVPLLLLPAPRSGFAEISIQAKDGLLTLRVRAVPLVDVLESLSHQTGLKVVYEGRRPSQLVTADIEKLSETEALSRLLEGLDIDYAFHSDARGTRVEMIIISASTGTAAPGASSQRSSRPSAFRGRGGEPPEVEAPPPPDAAEADATGSGDGEPMPLPGMEGEPGDPMAASGEIASPEFPSPASYPSMVPFIPNNASYPPRPLQPFD